MKKIIGILGILLLLSTTNETTVYICVSPGAEVYHLNEKCPGLEHCKHTVAKVTRTEAIEKYGRRLCKLEY